MKKVNWGVLGTAGIAKGHTIPGMQLAENCNLYAIAGRSMEKAQAFQQEFGFEKAYDSYLSAARGELSIRFSVDATGAGDAFLSGFIYGLYNDFDFRKVFKLLSFKISLTVVLKLFIPSKEV